MPGNNRKRILARFVLKYTPAPCSNAVLQDEESVDPKEISGTAPGAARVAAFGRRDGMRQSAHLAGIAAGQSEILTIESYALASKRAKMKGTPVFAE